MQVGRWAACGGITTFGYNAADPSMCCPTGYTCQEYDRFFWQCQPEGWEQTMRPRGTWDDSCTGSKVGSHALHPCGFLAAYYFQFTLCAQVAR